MNDQAIHALDAAVAQAEVNTQALVDLMFKAAETLMQAQREKSQLVQEMARLESRLALKAVECVALRRELMVERAITAKLTEHIENGHEEQNDENQKNI